MIDSVLLFGGGLVAGFLIAVFILCRSGDDMIERQRRDSAGSGSAPRPPSAPRAPAISDASEEEVETLDLSDDPELREAFMRGQKINAIKIVRDRTGLGLKEAKDLVESQWPH